MYFRFGRSDKSIDFTMIVCIFGFWFIYSEVTVIGAVKIFQPQR